MPPQSRSDQNRNVHTHELASANKRLLRTLSRHYDTDDVLNAARTFIEQQPDEWVNFSRVSQHLYETFYKLKPKHLGQPDTKYKSLLKLLSDYPRFFELRPDDEKASVFWIRIVDGGTQHEDL